MKLTFSHSRESGNPVGKINPAKRGNWFCRYAATLFCWIPACAEMTEHGDLT